MKSDFYQLYVNFNPQEQEPKYDEVEQLYDQTCANVFCQFLAEINKKLNEPYYFDILFTFFMMLAKAIDEEMEKIQKHEDQIEKPVQENSQSERNVKHTRVQSESIKSIINIINVFMMRLIPKYRKQYNLEKVSLFANNNVAKLIQHFFNWLTNKKYLCFKLRLNESYNFSNESNTIQKQ